MSSSKDKRAEFARLFELFEHLVTRKPRATKEGSSQSEDTQNILVPEDLAPIIESLATIVGTRATPNKSGGRSRRNTVAEGLLHTEDLASDSEDDAESLAKFPVNKQFPFTFKMMLHKLYQMEDWGRKVKEVLEKSQMEFKPLAEQEMSSKEKGNDGGMGIEQYKGRKGNLAGRSRSQSVAATRNPNGIEVSGATSIERREEVRSLKKRCVGRRKSFGGPMTMEVGTNESNWVYDATVSALENPRRQAIVKFAEAVPSEQSKTTAKNGDRYQSLGLGDQRPIIMKRRMSVGVPLSINPQPTLFQVATNQSRQGTRKRAMTVMNDTPSTGSILGRTMKRPFAP